MVLKLKAIWQPAGYLVYNEAANQEPLANAQFDLNPEACPS